MKRKSTFAVMVPGVCLVLALVVLSSCCQRTGKAGVGAHQPPAAGEFSFLFYADTREDPRFTNWGQVLHEQFVKRMLDNEQGNGVEHLVFGGDNVWLGFFNPMWDRYFEVTKILTDNGIKIYPAIGNHELWLPMLGYGVFKMYAKKTRSPDSEAARFLKDLGEAADDEEKLENRIDDEVFMKKLSDMAAREMAEPTFEDDYRKFLEQLEREYDPEKPADIFKQIAESYEVTQALSLYTIREKEVKLGKESTNWKRFQKYVQQWPHLKDIEQIEQKKTYYSFLLPDDENAQVKIIIIDSNKSMIDDPVQKAWLEEELQFDGPLVVACHHPVFYDLGWFDWKTPPHLVLTGHVHDYERLSLTEQGDSAPVYIISGSGGAYLRGSEAHCKGERTRVYKKLYNYTRITIAGDKIRVKVFGRKNIKCRRLQLIDELEFTWRR